MDREIKSLDIGTMHLISASISKDHKVRFKKLRNAFLRVQVEASMTQFLKNEEMQYAEIGRDLYALGESAFKTAGITAKPISRPMQDGVLNPKEKRAEVILKILIEALVGKAEGPGAICYYSVPAEPFQRESRLVYHSEIIHAILEGLGYRATAVNEGLAVVYSGLSEQRFTGIGISCGCGLLNVCLSHKGQIIDAFSIDRAGDWIDDNAAKAIGELPHQIRSVKEGGVNLLAPQGRVENAVAIYYKDLIAHAVECLKARLAASGKLAVFKDPVSMVCAGGTALPSGFISLLRTAVRKARLPLKIDQVGLAKDPLYAIARGCLIGAVNNSGISLGNSSSKTRRAACRPKKPVKSARSKRAPSRKAPLKRKKPHR
ncbi:MAG: hypothetical protein WCO69_04420 [Candidatus Omnitrophota bacterium]